MIRAHRATNLGRLFAVVGTVVVGISLVFALALSARPALAQLRTLGEMQLPEPPPPPVGDPYTLTLEAVPVTQPVSDSVTLTALVQDEEGAWVPSVVITFGTAFDLGDGGFSGLTATTDTDGQASTTVSSTLQGTALFTATTATGITGTAEVTFTALADKIEVGISQSMLAPGMEATVVATVTTPSGDPVDDGTEITFGVNPTSLGDVAPLSAETVGGIATTTFTAGEEGTGYVWARIGDDGPDDTVEVAVEYLKTYLPMVLRNYPPPWEVGSGSTSRTVYHINACPDHTEVLYAGSYDKILKSTDGGESWDDDHSPSGTYLWSAAVVPGTNCNTVVATVWGQGVRKSTNGGVSWITPSGAQPPDNVFYVVADSSNPGVLYAATDGQGVYKSTNSGDDWSPAALGGEVVLYLASDPDNSSRIYASVLGEGIYKRDPHTGVWDMASSDLSGRTILGISVAPDTGGDVVIAATTDRGVFVTTDGGDNWSRWGALGYDQNVESVLAFEFEGRLVFLAGSRYHGVYRSTDEGVSWETYSSGLTDMRARTLSSASAVVTKGDYIYLGSGDGAWRRMLVP